MHLTYHHEHGCLLSADDTTVLRVPPPSECFPTDRFAICASNGTGSGPRCILSNLTRNQIRALALNILKEIG